MRINCREGNTRISESALSIEFGICGRRQRRRRCACGGRHGFDARAPQWTRERAALLDLHRAAEGLRVPVRPPLLPRVRALAAAHYLPAVPRACHATHRTLLRTAYWELILLANGYSHAESGLLVQLCIIDEHLLYYMNNSFLLGVLHIQIRPSS